MTRLAIGRFVWGSAAALCAGVMFWLLVAGAGRAWEWLQTVRSGDAMVLAHVVTVAVGIVGLLVKRRWGWRCGEEAGKATDPA